MKRYSDARLAVLALSSVRRRAEPAVDPAFAQRLEARIRRAWDAEGPGSRPSR